MRKRRGRKISAVVKLTPDEEDPGHEEQQRTRSGRTLFPTLSRSRSRHPLGSIVQQSDREREAIGVRKGVEISRSQTVYCIGHPTFPIPKYDIPRRCGNRAIVMQLPGVTLNAPSQSHLYIARQNRHWTKSSCGSKRLT